MATAKEIEDFMDAIYKECMSDLVDKDKAERVISDPVDEDVTTVSTGLIELFK